MEENRLSQKEILGNVRPMEPEDISQAITLCEKGATAYRLSEVHTEVTKVKFQASKLLTPQTIRGRRALGIVLDVRILCILGSSSLKSQEI